MSGIEYKMTKKITKGKSSIICNKSMKDILHGHQQLRVQRLCDSNFIESILLTGIHSQSQGQESEKGH